MATASATQTNIKLVLECFDPPNIYELGLRHCPPPTEVMSAVPGNPVTIKVFIGKKSTKLKFEIAAISSVTCQPEGSMWVLYGYSQGELSSRPQKTCLIFDPSGKLVIIRFLRCGTSFLADIAPETNQDPKVDA